MCGMPLHVKALAFKVWRDCISNMIHTATNSLQPANLVNLHEIRDKFAYHYHFEGKVPKLKQITTVLELAVWKIKINEMSHNNKNQTHCQK